MVSPLFRFYSSASSSPKRFLDRLRTCRSVEDLNNMKSVLVVNGHIKDEPFLVQFMNSCLDLGVPEAALSVLQTVEKPSLTLQNTTIKALCNYGLYEEALHLFANFRSFGCPSDHFTFPSVIKACSVSGALKTGKSIHSVVLKNGVERNVVVQTALVDFYAKNGCISVARKLVDEIPEPDLISLNALISGYSAKGFDHEAFGAFRRIQDCSLSPNLSSFASVISVCSRLGCLDTGKSLHGLAIKAGCLSNNFLVPALISMYAGDKDLSASGQLFDSAAPEKRVTVWNAMINTCVKKHNIFSESFEMFRKMLRAEIRPDLITFVSILPSCTNLWYCKSLHLCVIKNGLENQSSVLAALLSMYGRVGDICAAESLFDRIGNKNLLVNNSMISAYGNNGLWDLGLAAFREMQFSGFNPDAITVLSILSVCAKVNALMLGKSVHSFCIRNGFEANLNISNALVGFYFDCRELCSTLKVFHRIGDKNVVSWNTLLSGYAEEGHLQMVDTVLHEMQKEGTKFDLVTLIGVLPVYCKSKNLGKGMIFHGHAIRTGLGSNVSLVNALISMYCNCGDLEAGKALFETMLDRDVVSWNAMITGYRHHNSLPEALVLYNRMIEENHEPNGVTLLNLLPLCRTQLQGQSIHGFAVRRGIVQEVSILSSLISMYARFGNTSSCLSMFQIYKKNKSEISLWNSVISAHVHTNNSEKAVSFFRQLLQTVLEPDNTTILSLISAGVQLSSHTFADSIMGYIIKTGYDRGRAIANALVHLNASCGSIHVSEKLFEDLLERNTVSWNIMINAYGSHGDGEAAFRMFSEMQISGLKANETTYLCILSACSHTGMINHARMVFNSMVENGISPGIEHYACMVDLLGRTGHLREAYDMIKKLPFETSESLIRSFLGACRNYGNFELGERISKMLDDMNPENSEAYVSLYGIYAAAGRWEDADRVRTKMEARKLQKTPGFSLLIGDENLR